ncbi:MAG: hypothetical protein BWY19_01122 [bacterium ADurb.Bin212]|nr:MAG: hypothetical protein BWY19_01122 [bacterium ADurb.Bin212]
MNDTPSDNIEKPIRGGTCPDLASAILDKISWLENLFAFLSIFSFVGGYYLSLKFSLDYQPFIVLGIVIGLITILYKHLALIFILLIVIVKEKLSK